jgi:uncharacterized protein (TIGR04255 family)
MRNLPDYDAPPVIETLLGVEFVALEKWAIPHFGLFWHSIQGHYPHYEVNPPLISEIERLEIQFRQAQAPRVEFVSKPEVRCWFLNEANTELVQIQSDRFLHNWRKVVGTEAYPHYEDHIRPSFERDWRGYCGFLASEKLGDPDVRQCEVTYVNHIDRGKGWETMADLPRLFPSWAGAASGNFLPAPESVLLNVSYLIPQDRGRLRISVVHAFRSSDATETLQLTLTARGKPRSSAISDILEWLDLGREWVVRGFTDFTSERMHQVWGRKV